MLKRKFGVEGEELSVVGFGGIVVKDEAQNDADSYVAEAIDAGINYFDVAPGYGDAQMKLGQALCGKRNKIFLACKTEKRMAVDARAALENSLKLLKTDYFDLYQLHGIASMEDAEKVSGEGGAAQVLIKAKEEGLVRHIGFSAHSEEAALTLIESFPFESVLFPVNCFAMIKSGFGRKILGKASEKGITKLALKAMAFTKWSQIETAGTREYKKTWYRPLDDETLAKLALRFTLSQSVTSAIPPGDVRLFRLALKCAADFKPVSEEEVELLKQAGEGFEPIFT